MPLIKNTLFDDRYLLKKLLGRGGYSEVWLVEDSKVGNKKMALKIYAPGMGLDDDGVQLFSSEFELVFDLNHGSLLRPSHFDVCERSPYLVLPFCERGSAAKIVGNITEEEAWRFLHDVASGLAHLHEQAPPIIHQDVKPDNVLISNSGNFLITDFGISTKARGALRKSVGEPKSAGTLAYMPGEKFGKNNEAMSANDIWALGAAVFELLTGAPPFQEHGGALQMKGAEIPNIHGEWSNDLQETVKRCLQREPDDRPTAAQLVKWTEQHANNEKIDFKGKKKKKKAPKESRKIMYSLIAVLALLAGCVFLLKMLLFSAPSCNFVDPYLAGATEKSAIVMLSGERHGSVSVYVIDKDKNNNWTSIVSKEHNYSANRMDSVRTFIDNHLTYQGLKGKTLYAYTGNKAFVENLLRVEQKDRLEEWNRDKIDEYLFDATVPSDYRHNSCALRIEGKKTSISWRTTNGSFEIRFIPNMGYSIVNNTDKEAIRRIIDLIPNENRTYFFTSGYGIVGMDNRIGESFNSDFIPASKLMAHQVSESGDMKRVCDIYKTLESAAKTNCFFYRKNVRPEIGYLLYNEK